MENCREEKKFIKIIDDKIAISLADSGFSYMKETINNEQEVFVFEATDEFMNAVSQYMTFSDDGSQSGIVLIEDCTLSF